MKPSNKKLSGSAFESMEVECNKYRLEVWHSREPGGRGPSANRPVGSRNHRTWGGWVSRSDGGDLPSPPLYVDKNLRQPPPPFGLPRQNFFPRIHVRAVRLPPTPPPPPPGR